MSNSIQAKAHAKINLFLHLTGRRASGLHEINSVFSFLSLHDEIYMEKASGLSVEFTGQFSEKLNPENNSVTTVVKALKEKIPDIDINFRITIKKNIPVAAGLAGGSADAATVVKKLLYISKKNLNKNILDNILLCAGLDTISCYNASDLFVEGMGEIISPIETDLEGKYVLLVYPSIRLETGMIYAYFRDSNMKFSPKIVYPRSITLSKMKDNKLFKNDLTQSAIKHCPIIENILKEIGFLPGCCLARMTGSGPACFGIFDNETNLKSARQKMSSIFPEFLLECAHFL